MAAGINNVISPEHDDGSGADLCVITSSAAQPLRLVLAGLVGPAFAAFYNFGTDFLPLMNSSRIFGVSVKKK